jgi:hypothetical protein
MTQRASKATTTFCQRGIGLAIIPLVESNADPPLIAPNDMTVAIAKFRIDQKAKRIRDFQIVLDLKVCAAYRDVVNHAINGGALERDRPGM